MEEKLDFATLLEKALGESERSQSWLATRLKVTPTTVNRWCLGTAMPKNQELIIRIADILHIDKKSLLKAAGYVYQEKGVKTIESEHSGMILSGAPLPPRLFIGRDKDVKALQQRLTGEDSTTVLTAVRGWPGVGKTTLIAALAHNTALQRFFPDGILWTALGEEPSLLLSLGEWMIALGEDPQRYPTLEGRSARLRAMMQNRKILLFIDDVWKAEHAVPFLVGGQSCRMLIATRQPEVAHDLGVPRQAVYLLGVLSDSEALELLRKLAPDATNIDHQGTLKLVKELEGLPLALQVAGRLLAEEAAMGWGINELLTELIDGTKLMNAKAPTDRTDLETQTTPTIAILLKKSTDRLDPITRDRFALLGVFVSKPATFDSTAAGAAWDTDDPKPTLRTLVNRGLLEPVLDGRFQMHSLLTIHARMLCEEGV